MTLAHDVQTSHTYYGQKDHICNKLGLIRNLLEFSTKNASSVSCQHSIQWIKSRLVSDFLDHNDKWKEHRNNYGTDDHGKKDDHNGLNQ